MDLQGYEHAKFTFAEILQALTFVEKVAADRALSDRVRELLVRLAEDRFNLAVVGGFSRGKSSLMNAFLGLDRLPTGILPLTSVITTVSYGSTEKISLKHRERRRLDLTINMDELPRYVTQQGNPGNMMGIAAANIALPAEVLRRGFYFVDTPGIGSSIAENTGTTQAYFPEVDAALLVTSFESPLSEDELDFYRKAFDVGLSVFIAVNKCDLVTPTQHIEVEDFIRSRIAILSPRAPEIFSVSAKDGIAAKLSHNAGLLQASGIPALEQRLTRFMIERKSTVFLQRMAGRLRELLADIPTFAGEEQIREQARLLYETHEEDQQVEEYAFIETPFSAKYTVNWMRGCEICEAVDNEVWAFLAKFQYALSAEQSVQIEFAHRSGLCSYHSFEYQQIASPFGTCAGYPALLERVATSLRTAFSCEAIDAVLPGHDKCNVCALRDMAEASQISNVVDRLQKHGPDLLKDLSILCLPHLARIGPKIEDQKTLQRLLAQQGEAAERLAEDMRRFTLKQKAGRRQLHTKEEETAADRALELLAGRRNVNFAAGQKFSTLSPN